MDKKNKRRKKISVWQKIMRKTKDTGQADCA